jgi:4-hydroxy-3-methylbut-2-enyl diphosphate reductase
VGVRHVARDADLILVVGSANSSNSNRLVEVARHQGTPAHLVDTFQDIQSAWLDGVTTVAVSAGASAPEILVQGVVNYLAENGFGEVEEVQAVAEDVTFNLPPEISQARLRSTGATTSTES